MPWSNFVELNVKNQKLPTFIVFQPSCDTRRGWDHEKIFCKLLLHSNEKIERVLQRKM